MLVNEKALATNLNLSISMGSIGILKDKEIQLAFKYPESNNALGFQLGHKSDKFQLLSADNNSFTNIEAYSLEGVWKFFFTDTKILFSQASLGVLYSNSKTELTDYRSIFLEPKDFISNDLAIIYSGHLGFFIPFEKNWNLEFILLGVGEYNTLQKTSKIKQKLSKIKHYGFLNIGVGFAF